MAVALAVFGVYKVFFAPYPIDEKTFPDQTFRSYVSENFDVDQNGELSRGEADVVEYIGKWNGETESYDEPLSGRGLSSLEGVSCFKNLKGLVVNGNLLTELDLSKNRELEYVCVNDGTLENINVTGCQQLHDLWLNVNVEVKGLSGDMSLSHLITGGEAKLVPSDTREIQYTYALDGRLLSNSEEGGWSDAKYAYTYDDFGNLVRSDYKSEYSHDVTTYEYDDLGRLVSSNQQGDDGNGYSEKRELSYDEVGRVSSYKQIWDNASNEFAYKYNDKGLLETVKVWQKNRTISTAGGVFSFKYDDSGNVISVAKKKTTGSYKQNVVYRFEYDSFGNVTSYSFEDLDDSTYNSTSQSVVSEDGRSSKEYPEDGSGYIERKYDEAHRLVEEKSIDDYGDIRSQKQYTYTSEGLLTKAVESIGDEEDSESSYKFSAIAHYGVKKTTTTVPLSDFFHEKYEMESGAYLPVAERFIYGYAQATTGTRLPYPVCKDFWLMDS